MSSTCCHRCKRMMASALPMCPRCGVSQDEASRAESGRRDRITWLAIGAGALLGLSLGWAVGGGTEALIVGALVGVLSGRAVVALRRGW
jgi:hypothetical protein